MFLRSETQYAAERSTLSVAGQNINHLNGIVAPSFNSSSHPADSEQASVESSDSSVSEDNGAQPGSSKQAASRPCVRVTPLAISRSNTPAQGPPVIEIRTASRASRGITPLESLLVKSTKPAGSSRKAPDYSIRASKEPS